MKRRNMRETRRCTGGEKQMADIVPAAATEREPPQHNHAWQTSFTESCKPGCPFYDFIHDFPEVAMPDRICGVICTCGPNMEPLACGWKSGHDGPHAWSALPTFTADAAAPAIAAQATTAERERLADAYQRGKADERETVLAWLRRDPTVPDLTWEIDHGHHETPDANQNPPQ